MKIEARFIDLDDVIKQGRTRHQVVAKRYNTGGLGDSVNFDLRNLRTGRVTKSLFFAHECLLEVERFDGEVGVRSEVG
jgi:hypothetical protein